MTMSVATLALELQNLTPTNDEAGAIDALVDAYGAFVSEAAALTPILSTGVELGKAAMKPALAGLNVTGQGAVVLQAGVIAFWTAVVVGLALSFAGATVVTPPTGNVLLVPALQLVFNANVAAKASLVDATETIATVMHAAAIVGGTVTTGAPPVVTPIL